MSEEEIRVSQSVAILIDGNNIERSLTTLTGKDGAMLNFDTTIPRLLKTRGLNRLIYFREGKKISSKLEERLHANYYGSVIPCHKSADIPLSIKATQLASKVDTIIIMSGDSDYIELVKHLQGEGVRVEIAAIDQNTSADLKERCDYFHPITEKDQFIFNGPKGSRTSSKPSFGSSGGAASRTNTSRKSSGSSSSSTRPSPSPSSAAKPSRSTKESGRSDEKQTGNSSRSGKSTDKK